LVTEEETEVEMAGDDRSWRASAATLLNAQRASFGALVMLIVQFAIGIVVNLYVSLPAADRHSGLLAAIGRAFSNGPAALAVHAGLGLLLLLAAVAVVVRSAMARHVPVIVTSIVGLLAILAAAANGASFVGDGGQSNASLAMALATAVAMLCYAVSVFVLGGGTGRGR
jgi:hypothetical protein